MAAGAPIPRPPGTSPTRTIDPQTPTDRTHTVSIAPDPTATRPIP
jgi:hypothetical protein